MEKLKTSWLPVAVVSLFMTAPSQSIARDLKTGLKIEIHIYNYSAVSAETLASADLETARIFERIRVATIWLVCPASSKEGFQNKACALPYATTRFTLRLFSNSPANRGRIGPDVFGYALMPLNDEFGLVANVYADRIRNLLIGGECVGVILGRLITHELGHLLLGKNGHSAAGIMHTHGEMRTGNCTGATRCCSCLERRRE